MSDKQIKCEGCSRMFTLTAGEQEFYQGRGMSAPKRCKNCREARKANREAGRVEEVGRQMDALFKPAPTKKRGKGDA